MKTIITTLITLTAFLGHSQWSQVHETIYGTSGGDDTGREVAISATGNIITITATGASMGGFVRGRVQVFEDDGASWVQLGTDIGGENNGDRFGNAVAMNTTGDIIAVGAQYHDELASNAGQVKVFQYDGVDWNQLGLDLLGENGSDYFGLILDENQHFGFLSSNRINGQGGDDIYSVEIKTPFFFGTTINGKTTDLNGDLLSNVKLELINADGDVIGETQSDEKGNFFIQTSEQGEISVKLTKDEYFDELQQLTDGKSGTDEINEDFSLEAIQTFKLNNLVTEKATGETVEAAEVTITDLKTNTIQSGLTDANGNIMLNYPEQRLSLGTHLRVEIKKEGFIANSFEIDTVFTNGANHNLDLSITKIEVGIDIAEAANLSKVESIFFDYNEAEILPTAEVELDKIVKLMNENPEIRIEIGSHTDARGSESFNMTLSKKRAKATAEYLRKRVDLDAKNRIRYKGYGESKLKNDCGNDVECTEEQHQENRRSEFIIIKI
jgi:outer membrane protein OmpA-like peptidoglycan-associated protein